MRTSINRRTVLLASSLSALTLLGSPPPSTADPSGGETDWRWIGLRQPGAAVCPPAGETSGWTTEPLFAASGNQELERFCLYRNTGQGDASALLALPLVRVDRDVMGVAPLGSVLGDETWEALEDHFRSQVGLVELPIGPPASVRLAILDTSPTGEALGADGPEDYDANSPHGTGLLNIARDLVCDPSELSCRATVASRLALNWICFSQTAPGPCRDTELGGYVGLIGDLAQSIQREVVESAGQPQRLVINLSLGWNQALGGSEVQVGDMSTPVQAAYRALEDAVCRGALPVVAAGNRDAAASPELGPFLPALWETRPAPSSQACLDLGVTPAPGLDGPAGYRPFVFSVAGIQANGSPLGLTRALGKPPLAAFADHGTVELSGLTAPTESLTGSSVASLVVSATAATVWSYWSEADPFQVMNLLYGSGQSLSHSPDYCLGGGACAGNWFEARRIDLCPAVAAVCNLEGSCVAPTCPPRTAIDLSTVDFSAFDTVPQLDMTTIDDDLGPQPLCNGETVFHDDTQPPPQYPCPHWQLDGPTKVPWIEPQPPSVPCPSCLGGFSSPGTLYFEVDDDWLGELSSATLKCGGNSYALGLGTLNAGDQVRLTNVPSHCLTAVPAFLSFAHGSSNAVLSPLFLCEGCL